MPKDEKTETARTGREKQRYNDGSRQVVGTLPMDPATDRVLLVASRNTPGSFSLPKGGWELDETQEEAALRETWEEAGIRGKIKRKLGPFYHTKTLANGNPSAEYYFYELEVEEVADKFPEAKERERKWFSLDEALSKVEIKHPTQQVLLACSMYERMRRNAGRVTRSSNPPSPATPPVYITRSALEEHKVHFDDNPTITIYDDGKKKKDKKK
jgi:diphosphoinositol-polyphosphate diphosphatase